MTRLRSVEELGALRGSIAAEKQRSGATCCLVINAGGCAQASGAAEVLRAVKRYLLEHGLQARAAIRVTGCQGLCESNPFILCEPEGSLYPHVKVSDVPLIVEAALAGEAVDELLYEDKATRERYRTQREIPFLRKQLRWILGNNQSIDPIRITDYLGVGGYSALEKVLARGDPLWVIEEIKRSELRGRGGAGFPTGLKWELARQAGARAHTKYLVCNADEGDPGAYMDRSLLEGNPHSVIEGMIVGAIAIGATKGVVYVRDEYPLAVKHVLIALRQAGDLGLVGKDILGSGIDFDVDIVRGAGAFVCGEETALIRSIEGHLAEPRQRPPFPIEKGIDGNPTCINNVETFANVPFIIDHGADEYTKVGVPGNRGTKIFSLVGKIANTGLVEVPLGTRISEVVYDIGGGAPRGAGVKAIQTGGPSGGCIPASMFDLPITYESLSKAGSIMGSGGMIAMDGNTCMVDVAKYFTGFLKGESCGKCFPCRKGIQRMYEILDDVTRGQATLDRIDLLEELALVVQDTTMCGLGQTASNPVLSTLRHFREEYVEHILDRRCAAGVCTDLTGAPCQAACPLGTEAWKYVAHVARGEWEEAYLAVRKSNPFPSVCARVCHHPCEARCRLGTSGADPVAVRALKRFVVDRVDPGVFSPERSERPGSREKRVAVVGAGPAGLAAAHYLSLMGYRSTIFESGPKPGGMLVKAIPAYRLPREVVEREIEALLDDDNITVRCGTAVGDEVTVQGLFEDGFDAVFLATGAHESTALGVEGERGSGVMSGLEFLDALNQRGTSLARGRVGVIGGGNSAIDAARAALRQKGVEEVTIYYRRTRSEMPAMAEEIDQALAEGVKLETLVSPRSISSTGGRVSGLSLIRNRLGDYGSDGRRRPVPLEGSEFTVSVDTLLSAVGERPATEWLPEGIGVKARSTVETDPRTLATAMRGVFAGGDVVAGPDTVVGAIAAGKRAAVMIDRYLRGEALVQQCEAQVPRTYVEPAREPEAVPRCEPPTIAIEGRKHGFQEVEGAMSEEQAIREARRCLRCDLEFTEPAGRQPAQTVGEEARASAR